MKAVTGMQMRALDQRTITERSISGYTLMERAGVLAGSRILEWLKQGFAGKGIPPVIFLAGKGNNGGDAFVAARFLYENGCDVSLYCLEDLSRITGDALAHFHRLPASLQEMAFIPIPDSVFTSENVLVDGLLGTGFRGSLRENYAALCRKINNSGAIVASLDIPSGLNADNGEADPDAVCAHATFTMAVPKIGMFSPQGIRLSGRVFVLDIGIPEEFLNEQTSALELTAHKEMALLLKREEFDIHKNSRGHVFVFGGSVLYSGAVLLSSEAALRSGSGLLTCFVPQGIRFYSSVPRALILRELPSRNGFFTGESLKDVKLSAADVIAAGPGMGQDEASVEFLAFLLQQEKTLVLDADALNLLAASKNLQTLLIRRNACTVLTPHPGEMKRLLEGFAPGKVFASREDQARFAAEKTHCIVVLKGARTLAASPEGRLCCNLSGTPALATAGSGDVLCGIISGMLCDQKRSAFDSVRLGVYLHGVAGELASSPMGSRGVIADDLLPRIPEAFRFLKADA